MRTCLVAVGAAGWLLSACGSTKSGPRAPFDAGADGGGATRTDVPVTSEDSGIDTTASRDSAPSSADTTQTEHGDSTQSSSRTDGGSDTTLVNDASATTSDRTDVGVETTTAVDDAMNGDAGCDDACQPEELRCELDTAGALVLVEQCQMVEATGCPAWQPIDGCAGGSCWSELASDGCDRTTDFAACTLTGLELCVVDDRSCPVWQPPTNASRAAAVSIDADATQFSGYGVLEVALKDGEGAPLDVSQPDSIVACITDSRAIAEPSDSPQVDKITALPNNGTYQLELSRYHLPVAYQLSVAVPGESPAWDSITLEPDAKSRVAFVSRTEGTGDLASWTDANDTALEAADAVCQSEAEDAGLAGHFAAYLSIDGQVDSVCRLKGADSSGLLANACAPLAPLSDEQLNAPFLDMQGLPIAYGTGDIERGMWRLPVGYRADGSFAQTNSPAWTGTDLRGVFTGADCLAWSNGASDNWAEATVDPFGAFPRPGAASDCDRMNSLLCFSSGTGHALRTDHEVAGKAAFVTPVDLTDEFSPADADAVCELAGGDSFVAWFSDDADDALCRLQGSHGKASENCDGAGAPQGGGPWVRADGYLIAANSAELASERLRAPLHLDLSGKFEPSVGEQEHVRTDSKPSGIWQPLNVGEVCVSGDRMQLDGAWTYNSGSCAVGADYQAFIYCFER